MQEAIRPGWWSRHWKWAVPALVVAALALALTAVLAIVWLVFGMLRASEPYTVGLAQAQAHPALIAALGEPIEAGWLVSGRIEHNGPRGNAELSIPLRGPKGRATLHLEARRRLGQWEFRHLVAELPDEHRRIDLLDAPADGAR